MKFIRFLEKGQVVFGLRFRFKFEDLRKVSRRFVDNFFNIFRWKGIFSYGIFCFVYIFYDFKVNNINS